MLFESSPKLRRLWGALFSLLLVALPARAGKPQAQAVESILFPHLGIQSLELPVSPGTRRCCLLGTNLKMFGIIPGKQTRDPASLGEHHFGGGHGEYNGNIATCRAGFIDTAHVRYAADLVAKLALQIEELGPKGGRLAPHFEGTRAVLEITPWPTDVADAAQYVIETAGAIALDQLSWHEIVTWYHFSEMPLYTEKGSSFSPEDAYSNQVGIYIGKRAIRTSIRYGISYASAVTRILNALLRQFEALPEEDAAWIMTHLEAGTAFDPLLADEPWFNPKYQIPNYRRLLKRQTHLYGDVKPTLPPASLLLDACRGESWSSDDLDFWSMNQQQYPGRYQFELRLKRGSKAYKAWNKRLPVIRAGDFATMIEEIRAEIATEWMNALL